MKISVITAVFNGGADIEATLKSVASQEHSSIEHIVVDGGSTDQTLEAIRKHRPPVARLISERDHGPYDAFNKGLRAATGDAIGFLGCGDIYNSSSAISTIVSGFSDPDVDAVFGDLEIVAKNDAGRVIRRYRSKLFAPKRMAYGFMPAHPTLFLRRRAYERAGEYSIQYRIASDFEMCLRVFATGKAKYRYIPEFLVRMRAGGLSNSGWRSKVAITREMRLACMANGVSTNWLKLNSRLPFKLLELLSL